MENNNIKTEETIAQEALRLLSTVPEENWITDRYTDGDGKCCAIGHFNRLKSKNQNDYNDYNCYERNESGLRQKSAEFLAKIHKTGFADIATVNNTNRINGYNQESIKDRVINCLKDMVKAGY
jgi:hypothetical protein